MNLYDLEEALMKQYTTLDDLNLILAMTDEDLSKASNLDKIQNMIIGTVALGAARLDVMFETYEKLANEYFEMQREPEPQHFDIKEHGVNAVKKDSDNLTDDEQRASTVSIDPFTGERIPSSVFIDPLTFEPVTSTGEPSEDADDYLFDDDDDDDGSAEVFESRKFRKD